MERLIEQTPQHTAERMWLRYGRDEALEFASQYALDAKWITKNASVEAYWDKVVELLVAFPM